jgi:hypothetical protein
VTLREEHRLRVFENRVLRGIFGPTRDEMIGNWKKFTMRSFITVLFDIYNYNDEVKGDDMGWACSTHGREE